MAEKITSINPQILIWARQTSRTTLEEAEQKFGKKKLHDWENGIDFPTYSQLKAICEFYRKPLAVCFFPEPPLMNNITASYRTLPSQMHGQIFSRNLVKTIDEARVMQLNLYELNNGENPSKSKITEVIFDRGDIDETARKLRKILNVDLATQKKITGLEEAFEFWRECFYQIGIHVFKSAFHDEGISGVCLYDEEFPVIYINNSFAMSRQIFTLFHEIFHIIHKTSGIDILDDSNLYDYAEGQDKKIEIYCNQFAGKFLVPDNDFDIAIKNKTPTDENIKRFADLYCVSREVILRKFYDRGMVSQEEYNERSQTYANDYFRSLNKKKESGKSSGNYYNTQSAYKGRQYIKLVFESYYSNKITITQLSEYMNMKIPIIQTLAAKKGWGVI